MVLIGPPSHAHPWRQQKIPARRQQIRKKHIFDDSYNFYEKENLKHVLPGGLKSRPREKNFRRFPEGVQKVCLCACIVCPTFHLCHAPPPEQAVLVLYPQ